LDATNTETARPQWKPKFLTIDKMYNDSDKPHVKIFGDIKLVQNEKFWDVYVNVKVINWEYLGKMSIRKWEHNLDTYRRAARKFAC
jgi:hypothetical protein